MHCSMQRLQSIDQIRKTKGKADVAIGARSQINLRTPKKSPTKTSVVFIGGHMEPHDSLEQIASLVGLWLASWILTLRCGRPHQRMKVGLD